MLVLANFCKMLAHQFGGCGCFGFGDFAPFQKIELNRISSKYCIPRNFCENGDFNNFTKNILIHVCNIKGMALQYFVTEQNS